jgi:hypothetical protein
MKAHRPAGDTREQWVRVRAAFSHPTTTRGRLIRYPFKTIFPLTQHSADGCRASAHFWSIAGGDPRRPFGIGHAGCPPMKSTSSAVHYHAAQQKQLSKKTAFALIASVLAVAGVLIAISH